MDQEASGSSALFAVFVVTIVSLFLIPYTIAVLLGGDGEESVETWNLKKQKQKPSVLSKVLKKLRRVMTWKMILAWTVYLGLLWYVSSTAKPLEKFDPFAILQVEETATEAEIKKAYRKLSLQYHPDKNPDPQAATYFAEYVTKAYKALTDETARENYKKHGHPDGPQAMSISVALPEWFFNKDKEAAPAILLTLLLGGIVVPLLFAACYLRRSQKQVGTNEIMMETVQFYVVGPFCIKQVQNVSKMPETMVCAMEFINLTLTQDEGNALVNGLRMDLIPFYPEMKDLNGPFYRKRPPGVVKAQILLHGHLLRQDIPQPLRKDFEFVLKKAPRLIQEMFAISSTIPRVKPAYGWSTPSIACVEFMQCLVRAVSVDEKKKFPSPLKSAEGPPAILQLPHLSSDTVKGLSKRKLRSIGDLLSLSPSELKSEMVNLNMSDRHISDIQQALDAFPKLHMTAEFVLDEGESSTALPEFLGATDVVTCKIKAVLSRKAHMNTDFDAEALNAKSVRAYAPNFPFPRDEHWIFMVINMKENAILGHARVPLVQAEKAGALHAANLSSGVDQEDIKKIMLEDGQDIEIKMLAPFAGKYDLTVVAMCDSWIGADEALMIPLRCIEATRAQKEGRAARPVPRKIERSEESEEIMAVGDDESEIQQAEISEEDSEEEDVLWDSDEYGTEESGSEDDEEDTMHPSDETKNS